MLVDVKVSPKMIYDKMSETVVGQDEVKRVVANAVYTHFVQYIMGHSHPSKSVNFTALKPLTLIHGPSGNGKTFIVKKALEALREIVGYNCCPLVEIDCTILTPSGYKGTNFAELVSNHIEEHANDALMRDSAIFYFDEFDKICGASNRDTDWHKEIQYSILKFLEGSTMVLPDSSDRRRTANQADPTYFGLIFSGNFPNLRRARDLEKRGNIGFNKLKDNSKSDKSTKRLLQDAGMATQLAGRLTSIVEVEKLTRDQLRKIIEQNLLPEYNKFYRALNDYELNVPDHVIEEVIDVAEHANLGARILKGELEEKLKDVLFNTEFSLVRSATSAQEFLLEHKIEENDPIEDIVDLDVEDSDDE